MGQNFHVMFGCNCLPLSISPTKKKESKFGFTYYKDIYHFIYSLFLFILYKILYRENRFLTYTIQ